MNHHATSHTKRNGWFNTMTLTQTDPGELGELCDAAIQSYYSTGGSLKSFPGFIRIIIRNAAWESRQIRTGEIVELGSLYELISEPPLRGWGEDPAHFEALLGKADPEVLVLFREAMHGTLSEQRRPTTEEKANKGSAATFIGRGNAYRQARIQRDCPDQLDLIKDGTKTIAQVAREQGWLPKTKRVSMTGDPEVDIRRIANAWGDDYFETLSKVWQETRI